MREQSCSRTDDTLAILSCAHKIAEIYFQPGGRYMSDAFTRIFRTAAEAARTEDRRRIWLTAYLAVGFPTLTALLTTYKDDVPLWLLIAITVVLLAISVIVAGTLHTNAQTVTRLYFDARAVKEMAERDVADAENRVRGLERDQAARLQTLEDELAASRRSIEALSYQNTAGFLWANLLVTYVLPDRPRPTLTESITEVMSYITDRRADLFGMTDARELFDFAVYVFDRESRMLENIWRFKHDRHPAAPKGRSWAPGQGHVGKAFADQVSKVTSDTRQQEARALLNAAPRLLRPYDEEVYRSFASFPIGPLPGADLPMGVLTASSNASRRFDYGNTEVLKHAATVLAYLFLDHQNDHKGEQGHPDAPSGSGIDAAGGVA